jgi:hypothetical protein
MDEEKFDLTPLKGKHVLVAEVTLDTDTDIGSIVADGHRLIGMGITNYSGTDGMEFRWCHGTNIEGIDPDKLWWEVFGVYEELFGEQESIALEIADNFLDPSTWNGESFAQFTDALAAKGIKITKAECGTQFAALTLEIN